MKKIMLVGRTGAGKTTLTQALKGEKITYHKTQYVNYYDVVIDTSGEYCENPALARALIVYSHEADIVGLLVNAAEAYSLYSPNIVSLSTREVIGIITHIHDTYANLPQAALWLELTGCKKVFYVDSVTGEGIPELLAYLKEDGDQLPWDEKYAQEVEKTNPLP
ncbi:ethanolamine utilization protein EutP [Megasphaera cerevisiae DSM 20462]|uniref:Ethanolamine utilization protein EutP n=1 Tax=Megasphaera cerevisiae DSM 20462 TaxID=1122219 RepID=A0A0J6ZML5_9FIRM|nr:EutP/PduV family microcompartment system protein [Megasphaera cerevisiae]KMO86136.1 ethanolamine utilization protein EutP [Megasphaera cerevisiae DSM 20462]SKA05174.1 ethanolamine utilization protein EutP [Megasphaera cerevisiae DSM 20462]